MSVGNTRRTGFRRSFSFVSIAIALLCVIDAQGAEAPARATGDLQYGVSLVAEIVASAGRICPAGSPCIFESGGGIAARGGWRGANGWYFGGVYELSKHDANDLYRLATFQQLRGEVRYYVPTGRTTQPVFTLGSGLSGFGNELGIATWGPLGSAAIGVETQLSGELALGFSVAYRAAIFNGFTDTAGTRRDGGPAQLMGIELSLEVLDRAAGSW